MARYRIRLEMGHNHEFPSGDSECGYELEAPLNEDGELDRQEWCLDPDSFAVRRFWRNEPEQFGKLLFVGGRSWHFHYGNNIECDEPVYQMELKKLCVNQFVSLRDHADEMHIFRIAKVKPVKAGIPQLRESGRSK